MTRNRGPWCRCRGMPAENTHCGLCGADHVRHVAAVQAAIVALWGSAGLTLYQTEVRAQRLSSARRTNPQRGTRAGRTPR